MQCRCDRCKREYESEATSVEDFETYRELLCPDCIADCDEEEFEENRWHTRPITPYNP
jgi:hypothetical protein